MMYEEKQRLIARKDITINGQVAIISGAVGPFALIRSLESPIQGTYAWETVRAVCAKGGTFRC